MTRNKGKSVPNKHGVVLMVGDGESEGAYFDRLSYLCKSAGIRTWSMGKNGPNVIIRKVSEYAKREGVDPRKGDLVAIVMDLDGRFTLDEVVRMDAECKKRGYSLFLSNPSFEVWLLSHYQLPSHPYTPAELVDDMKHKLGGRYDKARGFDFDDAMVDKAVKNARKLLPDDECNVEGCYKHNPSTMVHTLVETIRKRMSR